MAKRNKPINLPAPYLRRVWLDQTLVTDPEAYPFCLPFLAKGLNRVSITPLPSSWARTASANRHYSRASRRSPGYDQAGGGKGYMPVDHSRAIDVSGSDLSQALRAAWLPKVTTGWFFRAESFFSVARYLDDVGGGGGPDFLSHSHGEGFLRFFEERCQRQGIYMFDEPESALSPNRQIEFLKLLRRMEESSHCQEIMATHSPILMAYPGATLLRLAKYGLEPVTLWATDHFRVMREFCADPAGFVDAMMEE